MLGFSIAKAVFEGEDTFKSENDLIANHENIENYLEILKTRGIRSIELRSMKFDDEGKDYRKVLDLIWQMGFNLTVHIYGLENFHSLSFIDIYPSLKYIIANFEKYQSELILVVHALRYPDT